MNGPRIIAIETSSRRGSVAVAEGAICRGVAEFASDLRHAVELLPAIDRLVRAAGWAPTSIAQVYVSIGPGSFTGLRVAVTAARHLALAVGARLVAVPSLAVIAENARAAAARPEHVAVILDAKRAQVYGGHFERDDARDGYRPGGAPLVIDPVAWLAGLPRPLSVMGEGVAYHRAAVERSGATILDESLAWPRAEAVHRLGWALAEAGQFTPPGELAPLYLRRPEAEELWERRMSGGATGG